MLCCANSTSENLITHVSVEGLVQNPDFQNKSTVVNVTRQTCWHVMGFFFKEAQNDLCLSVQCFCQTAPFRESRIPFREGPQKNGERVNLALSFYKAACT